MHRQAMRPLKDLPVWVVVRLCTNDEKIVDYWNRVDEELELSMDVLDDLGGEVGLVNGDHACILHTLFPRHKKFTSTIHG